MVEKKIVVTNASGLHTRPAKQIVDEAKKFECEIMISKGDKSGSAKNLIKLMKLGITMNATITLVCDGADEQAALAAIESLIRNLAE